VRGRSRDSAYFSVVDDEWPVARDALERWLAAVPEDRPSLASLRRSAT
jgi:hypothetical protein